MTLNLLLSAHIIIALATVVYSLASLLRSKNKILRYNPKLDAGFAGATILSGVGLVFAGGSLIRSCISGTIILVMVYGIRRLAVPTVSQARSGK